VASLPWVTIRNVNDSERLAMFPHDIENGRPEYQKAQNGGEPMTIASTLV